jgi:copper chaperone
MVGWVATVTPHLNANNQIQSWEVDTANPHKVLTVETDNLSDENIREIVKKAGYKAETLS